MNENSSLKESRISRELLNLQICDLIALRSTCKRLNVGCIITRKGRIISSGYNGPGPTEDHCNDWQCDMEKSCPRSIHAEKNALNFISETSISLIGCTLYTTHSPCEQCAKSIAAYKISKVIYSTLFRDDKGIKVLLLNNIEVIPREQLQNNH